MTDIREDLVAFIQTATALRGSQDTPSGTWPEKRGPKILPFCDGSQLERTSIYLGDETGGFVEDYMQSGQIGYRLNSAFDVVMTVAPHPFATTMMLARLQISTIYTLFKTTPVMSNTKIVVLDEVNGPNPTGTDEGVYSIATISLVLTDFL